MLRVTFVLALAFGAAPSVAAMAAEPDGARIVISLRDRTLYLTQGDATQAFPVAIGRPGVAIPHGESTVVRKRRNPTWRPTAHQRAEKPSLPAAVPPGPRNPLGKFALDLGWPAIAIHGTNEPGSVGRRASGGCFRMLPADIESVFERVPVGTPVRVVDGPVEPPPRSLPPSRPPAPSPAPLMAPAMAPIPVAASVPAPSPPAQAVPVAATLPPPPPDPRCATATAPLRRLICDSPELALLDGRARQRGQSFLATLPVAARETATYTLTQDTRRFEERITALCWLRSGSESDPAAAAGARRCLDSALSNRLQDLDARITELRRRLGA